MVGRGSGNLFLNDDMEVKIDNFELATRVNFTVERKKWVVEELTGGKWRGGGEERWGVRIELSFCSLFSVPSPHQDLVGYSKQHSA